MTCMGFGTTRCFLVGIWERSGLPDFSSLGALGLFLEIRERRKVDRCTS